MRYTLACFRIAASGSRHAAQLSKVQEKLEHAQDSLRRSTERVVCSEERLLHSEDVRRRERARLCKAELDRERTLKWRRDYEARSPAAARAVALAILSASFSGYVRGVTMLVIRMWASLAARMRQARSWKANPTLTTSSTYATPDRLHASAPPSRQASIDDIGMVDAHRSREQALPEGIGDSSYTTSFAVRQAQPHLQADGAGSIVEQHVCDADSLGAPLGPDGACVWVDDEATEGLSQALANWKAWRKNCSGPTLLAMSSPASFGCASGAFDIVGSPA